MNDLMVESFSEDEGIEDEPVAENAPSEIRELLTRKVELEKKQRNQELHRQHVKVLSLFFTISRVLFIRSVKVHQFHIHNTS